MTEIILPGGGWQPRHYQIPFLQAMQSGIKRACLVWPRRYGKDTTALHFTAMETQQRVGLYLHFLPFATQARKVIWAGITRDGQRLIDMAFPKEMRANTRENEMSVEMLNGSVWQCVGSDNYDAIVGTNPVGVVFSEFALSNPSAWDIVRPILAENAGWSVFISTPRGHNHFFDMYEMAKTNPDWYAERLDLRTTDPAPYPLSVVEDDIAAGMEPALVQQEYYTSFNAPNQGDFFGAEMETAELHKRITNVPYETQLLVHAAWDLGVSDDMAIILFQQAGREIRIVDFIRDRGKGLSHYVDILKKKREFYRFSWGAMCLPHDVVVTELGTGQTRLRTLKNLMDGEGVTEWKTGIQMRYPETLVPIRAILPRCYFDRVRCDYLVKAFRAYHREYDDKNKIFRDKPAHDFASHPIDAAREMAIYCTRGSSHRHADRAIDKHRKEALRGRV